MYFSALRSVSVQILYLTIKGFVSIPKPGVDYLLYRSIPQQIQPGLKPIQTQRSWVQSFSHFPTQTLIHPLSTIIANGFSFTLLYLFKMYIFPFIIFCLVRNKNLPNGYSNPSHVWLLDQSKREAMKPNSATMVSLLWRRPGLQSRENHLWQEEEEEAFSTSPLITHLQCCPLIHSQET